MRVGLQQLSRWAAAGERQAVATCMVGVGMALLVTASPSMARCECASTWTPKGQSWGMRGGLRQLIRWAAAGERQEVAGKTRPRGLHLAGGQHGAMPMLGRRAHSGETVDTHPP
jgi:hypothetical protein